MQAPKISVVIVTYNAKPFIDRCLAPLLPHVGDDVEIIVWDNSSPDGTYEYIRGRYAQVSLFGETGNLGFARGNNEAFAKCRGGQILLLNPDAFLDSFDQILSLSRVLDGDPDVGAVGPMLINRDGSHQVGDAGWRHDLRRAAAHFLFLHKLFGVESLYLTNGRLQKRNHVDVEWVCGACMLVSRRVIDLVGGFDETIFMYGEDVEWGVRMRRSGFRVVYVPSVKVLHLQGAAQKDDENAVYASTKWLDALAVEMRRSTNALGFQAFKAIAVIGFLLRWAMLRLAALRRPGARGIRAVHMLKYAGFILDLAHTPPR